MAGPVSNFSIVVESASGDTENSTQTLNPLHWERAVWTLRRRAPHTISITVPAWSHHVPSDFVAHRELRLLRDAVYVSWGAGFLGAVQLARAGDDWQMEVPGYGNAAALVLFARGTYTGGFLGTTITGDIDAIITTILDEITHGSGGDWFPSGSRTLGTSGLTLTNYRTHGKAGLDVINEVTSLEGWAWRAGISAAGAFTFAASGSVETDRSSTIHAIDGANATITGVTQDDSRILTNVAVYCRMPDIRTQLNGAHLAAATTITVDSTAGLADDDWIKIGSGTTAESLTIDQVTSGTQFTLTSGLANNQGDNMEVVADTRYYRKDIRTASAAVAQTYHQHYEALVNDQVPEQTHRQEYGDALLTTYDSILRTATVETTDAALIGMMLDAGLEPGDSIKLTSQHRLLSAWYSGTTVRVQEMTLDLEPGGCRRITLQVGDPRLDDLAVLERMMAAPRTTTVAPQRL